MGGPTARLAAMVVVVVVALAWLHGFWTARQRSNAYVEAAWSFLSLHFIHRREASILGWMLRAAGLPLSLTSEAEQASILDTVWRGAAAIAQSARGVSSAIVLA